MSAGHAPEFSRPIAVAELRGSGRDVTASASAGERAALARRFGLVSIGGLAIEGRIESDADGGTVHVRARLTADVVQTCVVTLEPVAARIDSAFERLFSASVEDEWSDSPDIDGGETATGEAYPEPLVGGVLDIGEAASQHLALELDPFLRAPDADRALGGLPADDAGEMPGTNPFAVLASLKPRLSRGE